MIIIRKYPERQLHCWSTPLDRLGSDANETNQSERFCRKRTDYFKSKRAWTWKHSHEQSRSKCSFFLRHPKFKLTCFKPSFLILNSAASGVAREFCSGERGKKIEWERKFRTDVDGDFCSRSSSKDKRTRKTSTILMIYVIN